MGENQAKLLQPGVDLVVWGIKALILNLTKSMDR
jgi:hypothetical protein